MYRQHNDQKKQDKRTNNDLQNITHKTKDRVTRTPLKTGGELMLSGRISGSCSTSGTRRVNLVTQFLYV
jgi:4-diphosphocytidyl-2C-methyl-D-erythritol kinase